MTRERKAMFRIISIAVSILLIISIMPFAAANVGAVSRDDFQKTADASTLNGWKSYFYQNENQFNTANAGGVWTDKTVLADNKELNDLGITDTEIPDPSDKGFIGVLSAVGSNMTMSGEAAFPTDTVMVLDASGSMGEYDVAEMVNAANMAIETLMATNPQNRVGLVFFSDYITRFLSLDHYSSPDGIYLNSEVLKYTPPGESKEKTKVTIKLDPDVKDSANSHPYAPDRVAENSTYTQLGFTEALKIFKEGAAILDQENNPRLPFLMLMTDGAPTVAHMDFINPIGQNRFGDGVTTTKDTVFATQLTASYVKESVTEIYGKSHECAVYTLGMGVSSSGNYDYSECVFDPINQNGSDLDKDWANWSSAENGDEVYQTPKGPIIKAGIHKLSANYVEKYFKAATRDDLEDAFLQILNDLALKSVYYPTLVDKGSAQSSGYISFVDKVGKYMAVEKVNGLIINNKLHSGSALAKALFGGDLFGDNQIPTTLGNIFIDSIATRLGITSKEALALVNNAIDAKQMYYESNRDCSNYFSWYATADNKFISFCKDGLTPPEGAVYINKSYIYFGDGDKITATDASGMMYATVLVRVKISTGEQEVDFSIPASLVPTVLYNVELNKNNEIVNITSNGDKVSPIRLVYTTALDSRINKWNVGEVLDKDYTDSSKTNNCTVNSDGSVNFYNSKWDFEGLTGYGKENTYSYYRPSYKNDLHYFQQDTPLFTKVGKYLYSRYTDNTKPVSTDGTEYYYGITVYCKNGAGNFTKEIFYHILDGEVLSAVKQNAEGWYIPKSYVRRDYDDNGILKAGNTSETLKNYAVPYGDYTSGSGMASFLASGHKYVVGTSLGNNGRITLSAQTGVKITKKLANGTTVDPNKEFGFKVTSSNAALSKVDAYKVDANGQTAETEVEFNKGIATVKLKPNETLCIGGMLKGEKVKIEELSDEKFELKSLTVRGEADADGVAEITLGSLEIVQTVFTNGNKMISSESNAETEKSPVTKENNYILLWVAILFVTIATFTVSNIVIIRKKK